MFNSDSPYSSLKSGNGLELKLFTDFVNKDLKQNGGKQGVVLSFKDSKKSRSICLQSSAGLRIQPPKALSDALAVGIKVEL